jgi:hypothetical protein
VRGSLAVWYKPRVQDPQNIPQLDLHFNLWRDLPRPSDALDIGFEFEEPDAFEAIYFYTPGTVRLEYIEDLSGVLQDDATLSAIFNETLTVGADSDRAFEARSGQKVKLRVVKLALDQHLTLENIEDGTIIQITRAAFERLIEGRYKYYIRIRIKLLGDLAQVFRDDFDPSERIFLSAFYRTDVAEFRVNERRNFGKALRERYPRMEMPEIRVIQYFLVRSIATELVLSHADFRKVRRLEPGLWDHYLEGLGHVSAERMLIYHWRAGLDGNPVEDFIALALFRTARPNPLLFVGAVVVLGAAGSATQSLLTKFGVAIGLKDNWCLQMLIVGVLVLVVIGSYLIVAYGRIWRAQVVAAWSKLRKRVTRTPSSFLFS